MFPSGRAFTRTASAVLNSSMEDMSIPHCILIGINSSIGIGMDHSAVKLVQKPVADTLGVRQGIRPNLQLCRRKVSSINIRYIASGVCYDYVCYNLLF